MGLFESGQCEGCQFQCNYNPVERRAIFTRDFCTRAIANGQPGEMSKEGFKTWEQVLKEFNIYPKNLSVIHYPRM